MERKRAVDGNKHKIHENFDLLKKRFQTDILESRRQRAQHNKQSKLAYLGGRQRTQENIFDQIEKEEISKARKL